MALFDEALNMKTKTRWKTAMAFPPPLFVFVGASLQQDTDEEEARKDPSLKTQK